MTTLFIPTKSEDQISHEAIVENSMSEEKLRALLAEARAITQDSLDSNTTGFEAENEVCKCNACERYRNIIARIDAALAEPVESDAEKGRRLVAEAHESWTSKRVSFEEAWRLKDTQRIAKVGARNGVAPGTAFADLVEKLERERDEARAEVKRLKESNRLLHHDSDKEWGAAATAIAAAYQRGAEAMREAAASAVLTRFHLSSVTLAKSIRALPVPEDKR